MTTSKIGTRVGLAFGLVLLITAAIAVIGIWRLGTLKAASQEIASIEMERSLLAQQWMADIELNWVRASSALKTSDALYNQTLLEDTAVTYKTISQIQRRLGELIGDTVGDALMVEVAARRTVYVNARARLLAQKNAGQAVSAAMDRDLRPLMTAYVESLGKVVAHSKALMAEAQAQAISATTFSQWALGIGAAVSVLLGTLLAFMVVRSITAMRHLANHDALSGALNRTSFREALRAAGAGHAEGGPGFAVLCVDLDRFKEVNDTLGHAAGDEVLRQATRRLDLAVRHGDRVARLGGDEFAVLQAEVASHADVVALAERIVNALTMPYEVAGQRVQCGGSVGAAVHDVNARGEDDLLRKADLALYRAKASGRSTFIFYDATMGEEQQNRRTLTHDLRDAIGTDQMSLAFQPLYASDGRALTGYEALLRWQHPTRGIIGPAEFIPMAEEAGLIDALGRWVLQRACADAAGWPAPLSVAVNLSAAQFRNPGLVEVIRAALESARLAPDRLEIEITESLLMSHAEEVLVTLQKLSAMGIRIAMDDFGTGHSSLAYLWRFPFHKVKIDRSFTHNLGIDPKVDLIVRSIISLAHALGIRVTAEGIETASQMAKLQKYGCDELQGHLLGHPQPLQDLSHQGSTDPMKPAVLAARKVASGTRPRRRVITQPADLSG